MRRTSPHRSIVGLAAALVVAIAAPSSVALADTEVVVYVTGGGAGITITLTDVAGAVHTCSTDATGSCQIDGASPGRATVIAQRDGAPTSPRSVMIAEGKVSVFVPSP